MAYKCLGCSFVHPYWKCPKCGSTDAKKETKKQMEKRRLEFEANEERNGENE